MEINIALELLDLNNKYNENNLNKLTLHELKKNYHIKALNTHPDKNNAIDSNQKFTQINLAYSFLKNYILNDYKFTEFHNSLNPNNSNKEYINLLNNFLDLLINQDTYKLFEFRNECIDYFKKLIIPLLKKINLNILEDIYYNIHYTNISPNIISIIREIIENIFKEYNIYIIYSDFNKIYNCEVYKLDISNEIVYVPLWHKELIYNDKNTNENSIIKIIPILNKNLYIDDDNIIHYYYNNTFEFIINLIHQNINFITIYIENIECNIPIDKLYMKKSQIYIIKNKGLPIIDNNFIFEYTNKSCICIHITFD